MLDAAEPQRDAGLLPARSPAASPSLSPSIGLASLDPQPSPAHAPGEDSAWKELLELRFREFLELFFPEIARDIHWPRGVEFIDKELQPILPAARAGKQYVDKLVEVSLRSGGGTLLLTHVEVQGRPKARFDERMLEYNRRISLRYRRPVVSLAVLTDSSRRFRPGRYVERRWSFEINFSFPVVKLIDFEGRREELEASKNVFAQGVLAYLDTSERRTPRELSDAKFELFRRLYAKGMRRENVIAPLRFIDWLIQLPEHLEVELEERVEREIDGTRNMPYVTSWKRIGEKRGRRKGEAERVAQGPPAGR